jgi:hypothetical protein
VKLTEFILIGAVIVAIGGGAALLALVALAHDPPATVTPDPRYFDLRDARAPTDAGRQVQKW